MMYTHHYHSPFGPILLAADDLGFCGLWFEGQRHYANGLGEIYEEKELPVFTQVKNWLDTYFSGRIPTIDFPLHFIGSGFQKAVWEELCSIPYGHTLSYGDIAKRLGQKRRGGKVSARAVGAAVGHNKISIVVPCHRVLGADGSLTGYAGGLDRKKALLQLETSY